MSDKFNILSNCIFPEEILFLISEYASYYTYNNIIESYPFLKINLNEDTHTHVLSFNDLLGERLAGIMSPSFSNIYNDIKNGIVSNNVLLSQQLLKIFDNNGYDKDRIHDSIILFLGEAPNWNVAILMSANASHSYHFVNHWILFDINHLMEMGLIELDHSYKSIGETINEIEINDKLERNELVGDSIMKNNIHGNYLVGIYEVEDFCCKIKTNTKTIEFGIDYTDTYYPTSIWEFI